MSFAVGRPPRRNGHSPARRSKEPDARHVTAAGYFRWKDLPGRCLALAFFLPGLPIMAVTMLVVRLTSSGPVVYKQVRVGRYGRNFTMYKIRTMRIDAEAATGPVWTQQQDPRITRVGRWLRRMHFDEFPQLINVLKGEMALIGPRPERPEFTQRLAVAIPRYLERLAVRPGITGLAQINLPPDTDLDSVGRKLALDLLYVREGSLSLDLRILGCTFMRLFGIKGPRVTRLMGLECNAFQQQRAHSARLQLAADSGLDLGLIACESTSSALPSVLSLERSEGRPALIGGGDSASASRAAQHLDDEDDMLLGGPHLPR